VWIHSYVSGLGIYHQRKGCKLIAAMDANITACIRQGTGLVLVGVVGFLLQNRFCSRNMNNFGVKCKGRSKKPDYSNGTKLNVILFILNKYLIVMSAHHWDGQIMSKYLAQK
jgi:hypothetical protein